MSPRFCIDGNPGIASAGDADQSSIRVRAGAGLPNVLASSADALAGGFDRFAVLHGVGRCELTGRFAWRGAT